MPLLLLALLGVGGYWLYTKSVEPVYRVTFSHGGPPAGNIYLENINAPQPIAIAIMEADGTTHPADTQAGLGAISQTLHDPTSGNIQVTYTTPTGLVTNVVVLAANVVKT